MLKIKRSCVVNIFVNLFIVTKYESPFIFYASYVSNSSRSGY